MFIYRKVFSRGATHYIIVVRMWGSNHILSCWNTNKVTCIFSLKNMLYLSRNSCSVIRFSVRWHSVVIFSRDSVILDIAICTVTESTLSSPPSNSAISSIKLISSSLSTVSEFSLVQSLKTFQKETFNSI